MNQDVLTTEFISAFLDEADELLRAANGHFLAIEAALRAGSSARRPVRESFRAVHTIKGLAAMVGFEPIVTLSHRMESLLRSADRSGIIGVPAVEALLHGARWIEQQLREVAQGRSPPVADPSLIELFEHYEEHEESHAQPSVAIDLEPELLAKLTPGEQEHLAQGIAEGKRAIRLDFNPSHERAEGGLTISTVRERLGAVSEVVKVLPLAVAVSDEAPGGLSFAILALTGAALDEVARAAGLPPQSARAISARRPDAAPPLDADERAEHEQRQRAVVRVEVSRLDDAMERLSALIVTRFRLSRAVARLAAEGANVREISQILAENARQLRDIRATILRIRMVRVAEILERVPLIVRSLRRATGKQVKLQMDAGSAEVDKAVGERLFPALVHLVRNAIDHAIETPQERLAAGKPEEGTLTITCFERSNTQLELSVSDDGRGVDREAIARRAGAPVPGSDAALLDLLCRPGLSTREQVSQTSGRGMGMDIVKRMVEQLGGEILLRTKVGFGSTFTMRVPLTISIVEAFSLQAAGHRFVVPVTMVEEIIEVDPARLLETPALAQGRKLRVLERRGEAIPVVDLAAAFHFADEGALRSKALIVRRAGDPIAFAVDRMLGQQEVVVRPLEDRLIRTVGVSGATDLGDGQPTLVLDLVSLGGALLRNTDGRL